MPGLFAFLRLVLGQAGGACGQLIGQKTLEIVQIHGIELAKALHPDRGAAQPVRLELAPDDATAPLLPDQPRRRQHRQMLGYRRKADREGLNLRFIFEINENCVKISFAT